MVYFLLETGLISNLLILQTNDCYIYKLITLVTFFNRPLPVILHKVPCFTLKTTREGLTFLLKTGFVCNLWIFIVSCHKFAFFSFRQMTSTIGMLLLAALMAAGALAERQVYRLSLSALQHAASADPRRAAPIQRALEDVGAFAVEGLGDQYAQALQTLDRKAPACLQREVIEQCPNRMPSEADSKAKASRPR